MASPLLDPQRWHALPLANALERLRRRSVGRTTGGGHWINDGSLSPLDVYVYLKARFGEPNGFLMLTRTPSSDNLIQWHYSITADHHRLEIIGLNVRLEFISSTKLSSDDWLKLVKALKRDFERHGSKMSKMRKSLERWTLFVNPFRRLEKIVDDYSRRLRELDLEKIELPSTAHTGDKIEEYVQQMRALSRKVSEAAALGTVLRMVAPVMGEAFVNVLIFLLARSEIKKDKRLYEDLIRKDIDVRIKSLSLYCKGFARSIDASQREVKDFLAVMNSRNDFLHGNVDPRKLEFAEVFFDGTVPLFQEERSLAERGYLWRLKHIEPASAIRDVERVRQFVEFVLSCLEERKRAEVSLFLKEPQPGWREDTGRVGILFPEYVTDFIPDFRREKGK